MSIPVHLLYEEPVNTDYDDLQEITRNIKPDDDPDLRLWERWGDRRVAR